MDRLVTVRIASSGSVSDADRRSTADQRERVGVRLPHLGSPGSDGPVDQPVDQISGRATATPSIEDDFAGIDLPQLHQRTYLVRSYRDGDDRMRIRGAVQDIKPAGLYVSDDPDPLEVHHMVVDLVVEFPSLAIVDANVVMETHPHDECVRIEDHYRSLVGLSIARGFTHRVRELFGGPRGCTHTTALLQAMAPVAIQSMWSLRFPGSDGPSQGVAAPRVMTPEDRLSMLRFNVNSCHVWAEDGELLAHLEAGGEMPAPVWAEERMRALGRDPSEWSQQVRG
jgi:hypothetical protein